MNKNKHFMWGKYAISEIERVLVVNSQYNTTLHAHNFIELVYFEQGVGTHTINGQTYEVQPGDLFVLDANTQHEYTVAKLNKALQVKNVIFYADFLDKKSRPGHFLCDYYFSIFHKNYFTNNNHFIHISGDYNKDYLSLFRLIENELHMKNSNYLDVIKYSLKTIFLKAYRDEQQKSFKSSLNLYNVSVLNSTITYIKEHCNQSLTIKQLANNFNFSPNYFNLIFKTYTGTTLKSYIQKIRIEKACALLQTTDDSLETISNAVGYTQYKSFFYVFKTITGVSPNTYRKQAKKNPANT